MTAYLNNRLQESIAYQMSVKEHLNIGDKLKNVILGYFEDHQTNELTTDLTVLENYAMKLIDIFVNGYILILFLVVVSREVSLLALVGVVLSLLCIHLLEKISHQNSPYYHHIQNQLVEKVLEVVRGIQVIKSFSKENTSLQSFNNAVDESKIFLILFLNSNKGFLLFEIIHIYKNLN